MVGVRNTAETHPMVRSFAVARGALEELFEYYKVGRYGEALAEKPYALLSRCTHVVFSLWLADRESEGGFFQVASPPTAFHLGLDLGKLRPGKGEEHALDGDVLEGPLAKETKWFEFWMGLLEQLDSSNVRTYQEFAQRILAGVKQPDFLEGKAGRRNREAFQLFAKGDEAGRVMVRTMGVLEDFIRAIVDCFTTPEMRRCVLEQTILLAGLLREIRRIIIWETPATGPYLPGSDTRWRARSRWQWLFRHRTRGILMMVPRREGGQIVCTFHPAPDSRGCSASWERSMTALKGTYEEELFATWSYGSGEHRDHPEQFPDLKACWTVQNAEAGRLEILSREIDSLLDVLRRHPPCGGLVETVRRISRNDTSRWKATTLPWTYISELDQLLSQLVLVCDEAQAADGDDAASIIGHLWPSGEVAPARRELQDRSSRRTERAPSTLASTDGTWAPDRGASTPSRPVLCRQDQLPRATETPEPFFDQSAARQSEPSPSTPAPESALSCPTESTSDTLVSLTQRLRSEQTGDEKNAESEPQGHTAWPDTQDKAVNAEPVEQGTPGEDLVIDDGEQENACTLTESAGQKSEQVPELRSGASQPPVLEPQQESANLQPSGPAEQEGSEAESSSSASDLTTEPDQTCSAEASGVIAEHDPIHPVEVLDATADAEQMHAAEALDVITEPEQRYVAEAAGDIELVGTNSDEIGIPSPQERFEPGPAPPTEIADTARLSGTDDDLLRRLLEYHKGSKKTKQPGPCSSGELQRDLSWSQARLQRAMTNIFGPKPFSVYRSKCEDRTICAFLKALASGSAAGKSRSLRARVPPCPAAGAAQRGRQGSGRRRKAPGRT